MKMFNLHGRGRRAISPIVATVLIVAVTLVASVAIAGFVFGIFSTQANTAQVAVTATSMAAGDFKTTFATTTFTCGAAAGSFLTISNTGTAGATVTAITLTWAGSTNSYTLSGACAIGATGSTTSVQNILFSVGAQKVITANAASGGTFTGTVTLSNGAVLLYTGTFQ